MEHLGMVKFNDVHGRCSTTSCASRWPVALWGQEDGFFIGGAGSGKGAARGHEERGSGRAEDLELLKG